MSRRLCLFLLVGCGYAALAHAGGAEPMTFFVTSVGNGVAGGNYGGLTGADLRCQNLAQNAGAGDRTWFAYLSTSVHVGMPGSVQVDARDRIGDGPWHNFSGALIANDVASLHATMIPNALMLDETGDPVPNQGMANEHDILTGTNPDGTAKLDFPDNPAAPPPNCFNWTSNSDQAYTWVGHTDGADVFQPWNSAHTTTCDEIGLRSTAGTGRLYCFASPEDFGIFEDGFE